MFNQLIVYSLLFLSLMVSGCSSLSKLNLFDNTSDLEIQTRFDGQSVGEVISMLEQKLHTATVEEMNYYSPQNYSNAVELMRIVQKEIKNRARTNEIFRSAFKLDKWLEKGIQTRKFVIEELQMAFDLKKSLQRRGTEKTFLSRYKKVDEQMSQLISEMEQGHKNKITKHKINLIEKMQSLELDTIKYNSLHEAELIFDMAKNLGSEKMAPITHKIAWDAMDFAHKSIHLTPYDKNTVDKVSKNFTFAAQHVLHVTVEVIRLQKLDKQKLENIVLEEEQRLLEISAALNQPDRRNVSLVLQAQKLALAVKNQNSQNNLIENVIENGTNSDERLKKTITELKKLQHDMNTSVQEKQALKVTNKEMEKEVLILRSNISRLEKQILILKNNRLVNTQVGTDGKLVIPGTGLRKNDPVLNQEKGIPQEDAENKDKQSNLSPGTKNSSNNLRIKS